MPRATWATRLVTIRRGPVRASWLLDRTAASAIPAGTVFLSTFLLRKVDGGWQIVVYLNHQDLRSLASA